MGTTADHRKYRIRRGLSGLGLVSAGAFRKGERVIEYVGEIVDDAEADRRSNRYLFEVRKDVNIDGSARRNLARYVNHGCRPNCEDKIVGNRVFYVAVRAIRAGEELTVDYGKTYYDHYIAPKGCRCSAKRHRKAPAGARKNTR
jgi:SET domain-containing protein